MWTFNEEEQYMREKKWRFQNDTSKKVKFWFDCEFQDSDKLELISIGMVSENGVEYYAVSSEFNEEGTDFWNKDNVLPVLGTTDRMSIGEIKSDLIEFVGNCEPEFWSYFGAHDWVVLCNLFDGLFELPNNWPHYCKDLKQWADDLGNPTLPTMLMYKRHNSLFDARWHREVWYFLENINKTK